MPAFVRFWIKADNETEPIPDSLSQCEPRHVGLPLSCPTFESKILDGLATGSLMRHHRLTAFSAALTFAVFLTHAAPAQVDGSYEGHGAGKDDASRQGVEDARVRKADGATED